MALAKSIALLNTIFAEGPKKLVKIASKHTSGHLPFRQHRTRKNAILLENVSTRLRILGHLASFTLVERGAFPKVSNALARPRAFSLFGTAAMALPRLRFKRASAPSGI